ncbi:MAG: hypothetical protein ACP5KW_09385 [Thermoproteota archaeon]
MSLSLYVSKAKGRVVSYLYALRKRKGILNGIYEALGIGYLLSTYVLNFIIMLMLFLGKEVVIFEHSRFIATVEITVAVVFLPFVYKAVKKVLVH